jgi:2-polyprenyl-3-methyl-5-hydroxy-6-metoxy-1,4-benzoquinol methylase
MKPVNLNTPEYWNNVYRQEWESGQAQREGSARDYGPIHDAIINLIPDGSRVLDIACGPGFLCRKIKQRLPATTVLGVDFAEFMIQQNAERDRALGVAYRCLDVRTSLATLPGPFDVVSMCEILEHLEAPETTVATAFSLLRTGGRFILTCPHEDAIPDPEHLHTWGHDELFHLLAPYSGTISFMHFPPPWFHVWMLAYVIKDPLQSPEESAL